jgi:hypothetical protein
LALPGLEIRLLGRSSRSQSVYRLRYRGPSFDVHDENVETGSCPEDWVYFGWSSLPCNNEVLYLILSSTLHKYFNFTLKYHG